MDEVMVKGREERATDALPCPSVAVATSVIITPFHFPPNLQFVCYQSIVFILDFAIPYTLGDTMFHYVSAAELGPGLYSEGKLPRGSWEAAVI